MQTATELPRMEVQLPEFDYSNTLVKKELVQRAPSRATSVTPASGNQGTDQGTQL